MPTREEAKEGRRQDIVDAARKLMQKTGETGFSMRALADEANVSIATPYNLFGSKQTVMFAVLDADIEHYQKRLERLKADELEVFFKAVSLARTLYSDEPGFYRAVLFAAYNSGGTEFRSIFSGPRHHMWRRMVSNAKAAGMLAEEVDANYLAMNLGHIFFSCIIEWVNGVLTLPELEARVQYGFALTLRGMCTPASADRLFDKVIDTQKRLRSLRRKKQRALESSTAPKPRRKTAGGSH